MIKLIACFLAIQLTIQTCDKGCLRCANLSATSTEKVCVLCDLSSRYYLKDKTCTVSSADNCMVIDPTDGNCALCNQDYYLDSTTKKCVAVATDKKVTDCVYYDSQQSCLTCSTGKYLSQGACVAVTTTVQNCSAYQSAELCSACESNYYLSDDQKSCTQIPSTANCLVYSEFQCKSCDGNYLLNKNLYFNNRYQYDTTAELNLVYAYNLLNKSGERSLDNSVKVCQKKDVDDCVEFVDFNTCKTCNSGYYLDDKNKCTVYPYDQILNCSVYENESKCDQCEQGSLLKSNTSCVTITETDKKPGCKTYKTDTSTAQCIECQSTHYLSGSSCVERTNTSVTGCSTYSTTADKCSQCGTSQILSSDGLLCLNMPSQCMTVQSFTSTATQDSIVCTKCNDGYYLDTNKACVSGDVDNCKTYNTSANTCTVCDNKYFLKNDNTCHLHNDINQCVTYGNTNQNECVDCGDGYHNLIVNKYCKAFTEIANCTQYDLTGAESECEACASTYKLNTNKTCEPININQCTTYDTGNSECSACATGYGLAEKVNENGTKKGCLEGHEYVTTNCASGKLLDASTDYNDISCSACKENAFPYTDGDSNVCVNQNRIEQLPTTFSSLIDNCLVYNSSGNCTLCAQGKYLKHDGTECLENCDSSYIFAIDYDDTAIDDNNIVNVNVLNKCAQTAETNVAIKSSAVHASDLDIKIIKCKDWVTVMSDFTSDNKIDYTNVNPNASNNHQWISHPLDVFNIVSCPTHDAADEVDGNAVAQASDLRSDCDLFFDFDDKNYGCVKCKWGKVGSKTTYPEIVPAQTGATPSPASIALGTCESMSTCTTSTVYKNVNAYWNQFFSCHKCNSSNSIPVLTINTGGRDDSDITGFVKVNRDTSVDDKKAAATNNTYNEPLRCMDFSSKNNLLADLGIVNTIDTAKVNLLANCGLAVFNANYGNTNFDNSGAYNSSAGNIPTTDNNTALLCVSCKPGYKADWFTDKKNIVRQCTKIDNCADNGTAMNACETCSTGYLHKYDSGIVWDECVEIKSSRTGLEGCLAYQQSTAGEPEGTCKICKKGYMMNKDDYCEQITVPNCDSGRFEDNNDELKKKANLKYALYTYQNGYGCSKCSSGYISYPLGSLNVDKFCVVSNYVLSTKSSYSSKSTGDSDDSEFIANCQYYDNVTNAVTCNTCNDNYVLRDDKSECLSATSVPNCLTAENSGNECKVCKDGYALLTGGSCALGTIANCMTYYTSQEKTEQQCKVCNDGFYLETGNKVCSQGQIQNCKVYVNYQEYQCSTCNDGYWLVNNGHYCLKQIADLNCSTATFSSSTTSSSGTIECTGTCNNLWEKIVDNTANADVTQNTNYRKSRCFEMNQIANCDTYEDVFTTSSNSYSFTCQKCKDGFFLEKNGYVCTQRTVQPTNCATYVNNEDKCATCSGGYYLKVVNGKTDCLPNPTGVIKCRTYKYDATNGLACVACKENYYLSGGKCVEVVTEKRIANCMYYSNETTCSECSNNYYLSNNECKQVTVQNCAKLINEQSCEVCFSTHRIKTENGLNKCESFTKPNCASFEQTGDNKCLVCNKNFYPDSNGDCVAVSPLIANCEVAVSNTQCQRCSSDYALSADGTKCVEKGVYDSNCNQQVMPTNMECAMCSGGHYFSDGNCTAFSQNGSSTGCFTTDPADESECKVCSIGYYMKSDMKCYDMNPEVVDPEEEFTFIMKIMMVMFYVLYVQ